MPRLGTGSRAVITVSDFARAELQRAFGVPAHKMTVVSEGGEHILRTPADPTALTRMGLMSCHDTSPSGRPYVLAVSSMAAHKNFALVLQALALLPEAPFDVAIAGGSNPKVFGQAGALQSDRVKWLGYVSDAELRALYEGALAFVFPSLYEGFGIPPLEAMHCGCPVLAAQAASMPQVCGDAALYFSPTVASDLAAALTRVSQDAELRESLRTKGRAQAQRFSWETGARQMLQVCRKAMEVQS
jgi:glycosyltransferase involved in cell wall biosynthesis